jgi:uncharacterized protein
MDRHQQEPADDTGTGELVTDEAGHEHHHEHAMSFEDELAAFRARKDEFFRTSHQSPIPHERRHGFAGLRYFPPSEAHRIERVQLSPDPDPDPENTTEIVTSDGRTRTAWRVGTLEFDAPGGHARLAGYTFGRDERTGDLFVPFRDATSGQETYGAGRYLDLEPEEDGSYTVDFNVAYNPWCAYAPQYSCPLPPRENWLPFRVEAGEQDPGTAPAAEADERGHGGAHDDVETDPPMPLT